MGFAEILPVDLLSAVGALVSLASHVEPLHDNSIRD